MKNKLSLILILTLMCGGFAAAQKRRGAGRTRISAPVWNLNELYITNAMSDVPLKIDSETKTLPKDFHGHDFVKLYANLEKAVQQFSPNAAPEEKYQLLKNKKLLGNLTIDDHFIFKLRRDQTASGYSKDLSRRFYAALFQFRPEKKIDAGYDYVGPLCVGDAGGTAPPTSESREDFVKGLSGNAVIWEKSRLLVNSVLPIYNQKKYKGKPDTNPNIPDGCRGRRVLPNPQAQYELAFNKPQFLPLAESETSFLSLADYEYQPSKDAGVVAWIEDGERKLLESGDSAEVFFVVKLTAPFVKSETLTAKDEVENKEFMMFSRAFYVDIEGIWIVSQGTGKVLKKIEKSK